MEDKCILHTQEIEKLKTKVEELERKSMKHDDSIEKIKEDYINVNVLVTKILPNIVSEIKETTREIKKIWL